MSLSDQTQAFCQVKTCAWPDKWPTCREKNYLEASSLCTAYDLHNTLLEPDNIEILYM